MTARTIVEEFSPRSLEEADFKPRGRVYPSPRFWRDQIFYQLLPDRFSDGQESTRAQFDPDHPQQFQVKDKKAWMEAGTRFVGGTIRGIISKLDYLQGLGVTVLWINPPWKQRADLQTYHGYGIQNFLEIDPHFGTRQDLRDLVDAAHDRQMYVILDVIFNHSGNNWFYQDNLGEPSSTMRYRFSPSYPLYGWRSGKGECIEEIAGIEDGVWPKEFQNENCYTRAGEIGNWGLEYWEDPQSPDVQFRRGDFYDLKDFDLERVGVVEMLAQAYTYWIALTDCDGFRIDAVKHVSTGQCARFCTLVHEYAQTIGKDNFFLTGEITDNGIAPAYLDIFGRNLDSILGIVEFPNRLMDTVRGARDPNALFGKYDSNTQYGLYLQLGRFIVLVLDDHDMSSRAKKARFAAHGTAKNLEHQVAHAVGVQLTIPGLPAIYYGTEQAFNGNEDYHDYTVEPHRFAEDRYVRESMFGGDFGAFATQGCHFFNENHPTYLRIAAIARLRNLENILGKTLRRGQVFFRETSYLGYPFTLPKPGELIAWSMILLNSEVVMVLNTHELESRGAEITLEAKFHPPGSSLTYLYRSDWSDEKLKQTPTTESVTVIHYGDGRATVRLDLPPSGMVILA
jgi:glycosidase